MRDAVQLDLFSDQDNRSLLSRQMRYAGSHSGPEIKPPTKPRKIPVDPTPLPFHPDDQHLTTPTNPALHMVRNRNPMLNDYQFTHESGYSENRIDVYHKDNPVNPNDSWSNAHARVASLQWKHSGSDHDYDYDYDDDDGGYYHDEPHTNEVNMVSVKAEHRRKGIGTAMWDYANHHEDFEYERPVHSTNRSDVGFAWSKFVGGPEYERTQGHGYRTY